MTDGYDRSTFLIGMAAGLTIPVVGLVTGHLAAAYLVGAVVVGILIGVVAEVRRGRGPDRPGPRLSGADLSDRPRQGH